MQTHMTFERAIEELEKVVERLQRADLPLDEAVTLYRRGTELAQQSEELLSGAELQVQKLTDAVRERFEEYDAFGSDEDST
jgi:exodeoxyribonuclease VII small subunit